MFTLREIDWESQAGALRRFEAAYGTDRIYEVRVEGFSFALVERDLPVRFYKKYATADIAENFRTADYAVGAFDEESARLAGFLTAQYEAWNKSVHLSGIFVAPDAQNRGVGTLLLDAAVLYARTTRGNRLRLETQNVNYPAIRFYLRRGFTLAGIDVSFYDPDALAEETALFFSRTI